MKFLRYTREEHLFLLKLIYEEDHYDIKVLANIAFKEFNEVRSLKSYVIRISDIRHYILHGASSKFKKVLRNDVNEFIAMNSKKDKNFNEIFMYKIESLTGVIDIGDYPEL